MLVKIKKEKATCLSCKVGGLESSSTDRVIRVRG